MNEDTKDECVNSCDTNRFIRCYLNAPLRSGIRTNSNNCCPYTKWDDARMNCENYQSMFEASRMAALKWDKIIEDAKEMK